MHTTHRACTKKKNGKKRKVKESETSEEKFNSAERRCERIGDAQGSSSNSQSGGGRGAEAACLLPQASACVCAYEFVIGHLKKTKGDSPRSTMSQETSTRERWNKESGWGEGEGCLLEIKT